MGHMNKLHGRSVGVAVGTFGAVMHAAWALVVGTMPDVAQKFINFHFAMHFLTAPFTIQQFSWGGAIALVVYAFVVGYIVGRIFAAVYNSVARR